jgi:hypothetical protein
LWVLARIDSLRVPPDVLKGYAAELKKGGKGKQKKKKSTQNLVYATPLELDSRDLRQDAAPRTQVEDWQSEMMGPPIDQALRSHQPLERQQSL